MSKNVDNGMTAYVRYRLEKAQEVYEAACVFYNAAQWNSVINRLYYACFYSASALLLSSCFFYMVMALVWLALKNGYH